MLKIFVGKRSTYKLHALGRIRKSLIIEKAKKLDNVFICRQSI